MKLGNIIVPVNINNESNFISPQPLEFSRVKNTLMTNTGIINLNNSNDL
jgi:hypothetical protein